MLTLADVQRVYAACKSLRGGKNATYIPALAEVDPTLFAISICHVDGTVWNVGDYTTLVAIESVSKVFNLAYVVEQLGEAVVRRKIGAEKSTRAFNSLTAIKESRTHTLNSFTNGGAMATLSLVYRRNQKEFKRDLDANLNAFAGRKLKVDTTVFQSEITHLEHNLAIAFLLEGFQRFYGDVRQTVAMYTHLCSKKVTTADLAVMAATLAHGGVQPHTKERVVPASCVPYVLAQMRLNGMYQESDFWWQQVKYPGKSGVSGVIIIVVPGLFGVAILAPPLNRYGNSFKGTKAAYQLAPYLR